MLRPRSCQDQPRLIFQACESDGVPVPSLRSARHFNIPFMTSLPRHLSFCSNSAFLMDLGAFPCLKPVLTLIDKAPLQIKSQRIQAPRVHSFVKQNTGDKQRVIKLSQHNPLRKKMAEKKAKCYGCRWTVPKEVPSPWPVSGLHSPWNRNLWL